MAVTILITGATGLIGFHILLAALAAGHKVRYTARSKEKAQLVASNPAVQKLAPGDRLSAVIIPDCTVDGAFDPALEGITHVIHAGAPVPLPNLDPVTQVFEPTVKMSSGLLQSALKSPSVQRVVITSSIVANLGLLAPGSPAETARVSASTRVPLPSPVPNTFDDAFSAYVMGKMVELHNSDHFAQTQDPHFTISRVMPGYVFGRNELARDAAMMQTQNSSNNFLMMALLGAEAPFPIHGGFGHIDDVAQTHLRAALEDECAGKDYSIAVKVDYTSFFDPVEKSFPKAVAAGVFKKGVMPTLPMEYDSSNTEKLLGGKLKSFESCVVDVAGQYLEILGKERA